MHYSVRVKLFSLLYSVLFGACLSVGVFLFFFFNKKDVSSFDDWRHSSKRI